MPAARVKRKEGQKNSKFQGDKFQRGMQKEVARSGEGDSKEENDLATDETQTEQGLEGNVLQYHS